MDSVDFLEIGQFSAIDGIMKKIIIILFAFTVSTTVFSQSRIHYFIDGSTMSHNFNAAFAPEHGYFAIPVLGNINVSSTGNLGLYNLLYPLDNGSLGTFLHPDVPADLAMSRFRDMNNLGVNMQTDILNFGWFTKRNSFWNISLGLDADMGIGIPKDLFKALKVGMVSDPTSYSVAGLGVNANAHAHLAVGYSTPICDWLRIGAKLKFVASAADAYVHVDKLDLTMASDQWTVASKAAGTIYGSFLNFELDEDGKITGIAPDWSKPGLAGMGGAIDLGLEYAAPKGSPVYGLRAAASVTDLGFIYYSKDNIRKAESPDGTFVYDGFEGIGADMNVNDQLEGMKKDLYGLIELTEVTAEKDEARMLTTKFYASVDYSFLKDKMNVGLLYSAKFGRYFDEHELTVAWNYSPAHWFNVALSYSMVNTRSTIGWMISFLPHKGLNFFIGSDYTAFDYSPVGIPVKGSYLNANIGLCVPFGPKRL